VDQLICNHRVLGSIPAGCIPGAEALTQSRLFGARWCLHTACTFLGFKRPASRLTGPLFPTGVCTLLGPLNEGYLYAGLALASLGLGARVLSVHRQPKTQMKRPPPRLGAAEAPVASRHFWLVIGRDGRAG
jgi:hypothetical protein